MCLIGSGTSSKTWVMGEGTFWSRDCKHGVEGWCGVAYIACRLLARALEGVNFAVPLTNIRRPGQDLVMFLNNLPSIATHVTAESLTQGLVQNDIGVKSLSNRSLLAICPR